MQTQDYRELKKNREDPFSTAVEEFDMCFSSAEKRTDSLNSEKAAGRACPVIPGTMCEGMIQGVFIEKFEECRSCRFYQKAKEEENSFTPEIAALKKAG